MGPVELPTHVRTDPAADMRQGRPQKQRPRPSVDLTTSEGPDMKPT